MKWHLRTRIVGFCGKIYPVLELQAERWVGVDLRSSLALCRGIEQVDVFFEGHVGGDGLKAYRDEGKWYTRRKYRRARANRRRFDGSRVSFVQFFEECSRREGEFLRLFEERRCPVFVATREGDSGGRGELVWNASLKDVEFYRVFDPARAYQEVVVFLSNLAVPIKPIPVLDDKTMAEIKGFDRFSFRRDPIRKRKRRNGDYAS